ncbi:MAG: ribonuclease M5 [Turicibacter sp.]|nr:ribonuclease M5 [Turicibacter sp.]
MFKEIIVVEGRDDTRRLKEIYPQVETLETNGSAISKEVLSQIAYLQKNRGVIVFTDPDYPGEKIRQTIINAVPGCKHAYIQKSDAISPKKRGLGVEHAKASIIRNALENFMTPSEEHCPLIETDFLMGLGLIGGAGSAVKRRDLGVKLGIGHVNAKQLQKRLQMFGITKEQVEEALGHA